MRPAGHLAVVPSTASAPSAWVTRGAHGTVGVFMSIHE